jgi:hypothetical protein
MLKRGKIQWRVSWIDQTKEYPYRYQARDFDNRADADIFAQTVPVEPKPEPVEIQLGVLGGDR